MNNFQRVAVHLMPRNEDGMYFFEVYVRGKEGMEVDEVDRGYVFGSQGEAERKAEDLAEKYKLPVYRWKRWM